MFKKIVIPFIAILIVMAFTGCERIYQTPGQTTLRVPVYMTDRPMSDVDHLYVDITNVVYVYDEGCGDCTPVSLDVEVKNLDLLELAGEELDLFELDVPEGATLVYIRFYVSSATVVVDGESEPVEVKSGHVQININEQVEEGDSILLDFDVSMSLKQVGPPNNPRYILTPVLKHMYRRQSGSGNRSRIEGYVKKSGEPVWRALVALFDTDDSTVLRSTYTNREGHFRIGALQDGEYLLKVYESGILGDTPDYATTVVLNGELELVIDLGD